MPVSASAPRAAGAASRPRSASLPRPPRPTLRRRNGCSGRRNNLTRHSRARLPNGGLSAKEALRLLPTARREPRLVATHARADGRPAWRPSLACQLRLRPTRSTPNPAELLVEVPEAHSPNRRRATAPATYSSVLDCAITGPVEGRSGGLEDDDVDPVLFCFLVALFLFGETGRLPSGPSRSARAPHPTRRSHARTDTVPPKRW